MRIFSRPQNVTSEITQTTIQHRNLLKPGPLNPLIIGALAMSMRRYPIQLHGFVFLGTHLHVLATFVDAKRMADFMRHFTQKLSKEVKKVHDWDAVVFPKRYRHVELSQEPDIDLARLRYIFRNTCKENLVHSPLEWPGVSSAEALVTGEPMRGIWIDRTAYQRAKNRGKEVSVEDFTEELELHPHPGPFPNSPVTPRLSSIDDRHGPRSRSRNTPEAQGRWHRTDRSPGDHGPPSTPPPRQTRKVATPMVSRLEPRCTGSHEDSANLDHRRLSRSRRAIPAGRIRCRVSRGNLPTGASVRWPGECNRPSQARIA